MTHQDLMEGNIQHWFENRELEPVQTKGIDELAKLQTSFEDEIPYIIQAGGKAKAEAYQVLARKVLGFVPPMHVDTSHGFLYLRMAYAASDHSVIQWALRLSFLLFKMAIMSIIVPKDEPKEPK